MVGGAVDCASVVGGAVDCACAVAIAERARASYAIVIQNFSGTGDVIHRYVDESDLDGIKKE